MEVNCKIILPGNVRVKYVAEVIGKLAGLPAERSLVKEQPPGFVDVQGVEIQMLPMMPQCANICLTGIPAPAIGWHDNEQNVVVLYHFETVGTTRLLMPLSTPFWLAIGCGLIDFFGGDLIPSDYSEEVLRTGPPKSDEMNQPEDADSYWDLRNRIFELNPLTDRDFEAAKKHVLY